ncbi:HNH endonuclease [Vibrio fluvialis]
MAYFWVNLGATLKEVQEGHFLWAPAYTYTPKGNKTVKAGWRNVPKVKAGDTVICHEDKHVRFLAKAKTDAYEAPRPPNRKYDQWKKEGYRIDVELLHLSSPIPNDQFKLDFNLRFNEFCDPKLFNTDLNATENYMYSIPEGAAAIVLNCVIDDTTDFFDQPNTTPSTTPKTRTTKAERELEREVRAKARLGQGKFRKEILDLWNNKCPVTNANLPDVLIASHILPWAMSDNTEKVDKFNGFPFAPNVDKLFDKGLISFGNDGSLIKSETVTQDLLKAFGIDPDVKIDGLKEEQYKYLQRHREIFGLGE